VSSAGFRALLEGFEEGQNLRGTLFEGRMPRVTVRDPSGYISGGGRDHEQLRAADNGAVVGLT
jgi:hypothetical protein